MFKLFEVTKKEKTCRVFTQLEIVGPGGRDIAPCFYSGKTPGATVSDFQRSWWNTVTKYQHYHCYMLLFPVEAVKPHILGL